MSKWFEETKRPQGIVVSSRIRLARNIEGHVFSDKLSSDQKVELLEKISDGLSGLSFNSRDLEFMGEVSKEALHERRLINSSVVGKSGAMRLLSSADEAQSILIGGDDHIRMQGMGQGPCLYKNWEVMNDWINEKFHYAFHEKYGYLTAFPTNMGTGLRADVLLHLPMLSRDGKFSDLQEEISRMGVRLKAIKGNSSSDNPGNLYRLTNQKTLGLSEKEIIDNVERFSTQLATEERQMENEAVLERRGEIEDEVYKSYGVLKYARKLSDKECMMYLSWIRMGMANGLIALKKPVNIYGLMVLSGEGNLTSYAKRPLGKEEIPYIRGEFIRTHLPEIE